jgi:peptidyl-tRNA hydrolase
VLGDFNAEERVTLSEHLARAAEICESWTREGLQKAMNKWNGK